MATRSATPTHQFKVVSQPNPPANKVQGFVLAGYDHLGRLYDLADLRVQKQVVVEDEPSAANAAAVEDPIEEPDVIESKNQPKKPSTSSSGSTRATNSSSKTAEQHAAPSKKPSSSGTPQEAAPLTQRPREYQILDWGWGAVEEYKTPKEERETLRSELLDYIFQWLDQFPEMPDDVRMMQASVMFWVGMSASTAAKALYNQQTVWNEVTGKPDQEGQDRVLWKANSALAQIQHLYDSGQVKKKEWDGSKGSNKKGPPQKKLKF